MSASQARGRSNPRACTLVRASVISAAVSTAMFVFPSSAAAAPYPATAFTISPVSAATKCATLELGKPLGALPCTGATNQHFTYDGASKHLATGNGACVGSSGAAFGTALAGVPCDGKGGTPIVVDANPAGTADRERITYVKTGNGAQACFTLGKNGSIGGFACSGGPNQDFSVKPV